MKRLVAGSVFLVAAVELLALSLPDRRFVLAVSGVVVALVLLSVRRFMGDDVDAVPADSVSSDPAELLRRWLTRTETMIRWSESSRSDWDRHLRPILAREFEMATGHRKVKDPAVFHATGLMLFGEELWGWVDPENVAPAGSHEPGAGRAALEEILRRLEQI